MHPDLQKLRFSVKPFPVEGARPVELARTMAVHPLSYQELPHDPEYSLYAGRLTPEKMTNATPDEMYWAARQRIILRHTGEHPYEIAGPDALKLLQRIFPRDVSKVKTGRCSYQFACYHDGGMINDGVLVRLAQDRFWYGQADGDLCGIACAAPTRSKQRSRQFRSRSQPQTQSRPCPPSAMVWASIGRDC